MGLQKNGTDSSQERGGKKATQQAAVRTSLGAEGQREERTRRLTVPISEQNGVTPHRIEDGLH